MTKSKRQLRAEAVERLRTIPQTQATYSAYINALIGPIELRPDLTSGQDIADALIDLLTDDEPPEGDAVAIMRKVATCGECTGYTMRKEVGGIDWADALLILAGMIERDYVRRDSLTDDEPETITRDGIEEIMRNLAAEVTNGGVEIHGAIPIEDALKSAMRRVDDLLTDDEPQDEQDSREKLEEDVSSFNPLRGLRELANTSKHHTDAEWKKNLLRMVNNADDYICRFITELLDRQAAITESECADRYVNTWTEGSVAWILRQYEDEKLMRDVDCEAKVALETEELQAKVDALEADKRNWQDGYFLARLTELEEENRLWRERLRNMADDDVTVFGMKLDEVRNLQAENARLREMLSQALDHAHSISKLGDM